MTGYADHRLLKSGVFDRDHLLLGRPFTAAELVRRVRDALAADAPAI